MWVKPQDYKVVGEHLAELRRSVPLTQVELAKRLKKPQSFVSSYESGQRRLDLLEFLAVVSELGGDPKAASAAIFDMLSPKPKRGSKRP